MDRPLLPRDEGGRWDEFGWRCYDCRPAGRGRDWWGAPDPDRKTTAALLRTYEVQIVRRSYNTGLMNFTSLLDGKNVS